MANPLTGRFKFDCLKKIYEHYYPKCKHSRTELILRSRRYETVQEIKVDVWHDFIVGVKCQDCSDIMLTPEIMVTYYLYRGEPHYPVLGKEEDKEKTETEKEAEYERITNLDIDWFPGDCCD